jgi:steroid 5-alpha reductase family enzyme
MRIQTPAANELALTMPWHQFLWTGPALAVVFLLLWAVLGRAGRSGWADFAWASAIGLTGLCFAALADGWMPRRIAVAALALVWGGRLATHLGKRLSHEGEDGRYIAMADSMGTSYRSFMFGFFLLQAFMAWLFSLPFFVLAQSSAEGFTTPELVGLALWLLSLVGNNLADRQLAAWKSDPGNAGKTCRSGLWAWSRHPNYFFEWLIWCAYPVMAIGTPALPWAVAVAAFMFVMVRFISGVPYTEQQAVRSRGDDYRRYQASVSPFFPLPPKSS